MVQFTTWDICEWNTKAKSEIDDSFQIRSPWKIKNPMSSGPQAIKHCSVTSICSCWTQLSTKFQTDYFFLLILSNTLSYLPRKLNDIILVSQWKLKSKNYIWHLACPFLIQLKEGADEWIDECCLRSFLTVFQSYQDNGWMIMTGCVQ